MVVVGIDAHKRTHTAVAVDGTGRKLGEKTVPATIAGHTALLLWGRGRFGPDLTWGIEDVRTVTRRLEHDLLAAHQRVVRVPTNLMARTRTSARSYGKSDSIDATAIARALLRETDLSVAQHDSVSRELQLLTERREIHVAQRTAIVNRVQWRIHELDPSRTETLKPLKWARNRAPIAMWLADEPGLIAELARDELDEIARLTPLIDALEKRITQYVTAHATHLLAVPGCGALTAAKIMAETANVTRFKSEAAYARYIGVAPVPQSSGSTTGHVRFTRSGNRQLNKAIHRIAVSQLINGYAGRHYYDRRRQAGDSSAGALRHLKRRITRVVFSRLKADEAARRAAATKDSRSPE